MEYIVKFCYDNPNSYFVRVNEDQSWDEIQDPRLATKFSSPQECLDWVENNCDSLLSAKAGNFEEEKKKFEESLSKGIIRRSMPPIDRNLSIEYDPSKNDRIAVLKWNYFYAAQKSDRVLYKHYKTWQEFEKLFSFISGASFIDEYKTVVFNLMMRRNKGSFQEFQEEIELVENLSLEKNGLGKKVESVFSVDCYHFDESYHLVKFIDGSWCLKNEKVLGFKHCLVKGTLRECFDFLESIKD